MKALYPGDVKAAATTDAVKATSPPQTPSRLTHIEPPLPGRGAEAVPLAA
jgi:hypothetical protein